MSLHGFTRIQEKFSSIMQIGMPIVLVLLEIVYIQGEFPIRYAHLTMVAGASIILLNLTIKNWDSKTMLLSLSPFAILCFIVIWAGISGFITAVNYIPSALLFLAVASFYYVQSNSKFPIAKMNRSLSAGMTLAIIAVIIVNLLLHEVTSKFAGIYINPNGLSRVLVSAFAAIIYLHDTIRNKKKSSFPGAILLLFLFAISGLVIAMQFYTNSRAGIIVTLCLLTTYGIYALYYHKFLQFFVYAVIVLGFSVLLVLVLPSISKRIHQPIPRNPTALESSLIEPKPTQEAVKETQLVTISTPNVDEKTKELDAQAVANVVTSEIPAFWSEPSGTESSVLDDAIGLHDQRVQSSFGSLEGFFTNRLKIFRSYFWELNLLGHTPEQQGKLKETAKLPGNTAHNAFLEIAYDLGAPAGILFFILVVYFVYRNVVIFLKKKDSSDVILFTVLFLVSYCAYSIIESSYLPNTVGVWLFFISQGIVFVKDATET